MEFPSLGERCSRSDCNRLDFIPLRCRCSAFFCREHFLDHCLSGGCVHHVDVKAVPGIVTERVIHKCKDAECRNADLVEMPCEECRSHYCINHRFHKPCYDLNPESLVAQRKKLEEDNSKNEQTLQRIQKEITERLRNAENTSKAKTALKVQLMKLKSKSTGEKDIPTADRVYFSVRIPDGVREKVLRDTPVELSVTRSTLNDDGRKGVYVSRTWSLGRATDSMCNICGVANRNNVPDAPKLRPVRESDGMLVCPKRLDRTVESLLEDKTLIDGERVALEYFSQDSINACDEKLAYFLLR